MDHYQFNRSQREKSNETSFDISPKNLSKIIEKTNLTRTQIGLKCGVSSGQIQQWCNTGKLPAEKLALIMVHSVYYNPVIDIAGGIVPQLKKGDFFEMEIIADSKQKRIPVIVFLSALPRPSEIGQLHMLGIDEIFHLSDEDEVVHMKISEKIAKENPEETEQNIVLNEIKSENSNSPSNISTAKKVTTDGPLGQYPLETILEELETRGYEVSLKKIHRNN